jgi:NTE family protein
MDERVLREPPLPLVEGRPHRRSLPFETVALVLQGGGALGAYQAGVFQGLDEAGIAPNWVAGISIGALNTAIIAGNPPALRVARLRQFWETICRPAYLQPTAAFLQQWVERKGGEVRKAFNAFEAWRAILEGQNGFFVPRLPPPWLSVRLPLDGASYYDTGPLKQTLHEFVDFGRLNSGEVRVSVGAVNVRTGNLEYFDNTTGPWAGRLRAEHFMASGALPPAFPAVEIDGQHYWDGGLVSNTPLTRILSMWPRPDTLVFQVDLWSALGNLPTNIWDVQEREKDIRYSSRTRQVTAMMEREQKLRLLVRKLLERVPDDVNCHDEWCAEARQWAEDRRVGVIHLIYQDKEWDQLSKDYEFGALTMREHWTSGMEDIAKSLKHEDWLALPAGDVGFVTHDVHRRHGS